MKVKQVFVRNKLYVLDPTAYEITEVPEGASFILVPEDSYQEYVELNPDLKLTKYNYGVIKANVPDWYEEWQKEEQEGYSFSLSGYDIQSHVRVYFDNVEQTITDGNWSNIAQGTQIYISAEENSERYTVTNEDPANILVWNQSRLGWYITMPAEDVSVSIDYHEQVDPDVFTYTFTFITNDSSKFDLTINGVSKDPSDGSWSDVLENEEIIITPKESDPSLYTVNGTNDAVMPTWDNDRGYWSTTMPDHDIHVDIDYSGNGESK